MFLRVLASVINQRNPSSLLIAKYKKTGVVNDPLGQSCSHAIRS